MRFYSGQEKGISLKEALFQGFAPDGGLYLPEKLPHFSLDQLKKLRGRSFIEVSVEIGRALFGRELDIEAAFDFSVPLFRFPDQVYALELFHGPTLSFKDFGARLLAQLIKTLKKPDDLLTVLVATSGDTGSAVGKAFYGLPGVRVFILYPKGMVTPSQELQITTLGGNITTVEVEGSFEQCQDLLKQACLDPTLSNVTTANSINVGRLLAHTLYYFYAYSQLDKHGVPVLFSIPSGNFGHLVAGILAKRMGLPIARLIGATNINDEVPQFLRSGEFHPHPAYPTIAVSMDVGNPSNFPRLLELYDHSLEKMRTELVGISFTDQEIEQEILETLEKFDYLLDPHSAIGSLGLKKYQEKERLPGIFYATAHPAKFRESLEPLIHRRISLPEPLKITKTKEALSCPPDYEALRQLLK